MSAQAEHAVDREAMLQQALDAAIRAHGSGTRWFLVTRRVDLGLCSVDAFDSPRRAAMAKVKADGRAAKARGMPPAVCLFGGPDLATVIAHYPHWFDAPADLFAPSIEAGRR